jgi:signal transduction histidine kinase
LPNDAEFGHLESLIKTREKIELPAHYRQLMEECHVNAKKIEVIEMTNVDFLSSQLLMEGTTRRGDATTKEKIKFLKTRQITLYKDKPSHLFFKYDLKDNKVLLNIFEKKIKNLIFIEILKIKN